MVITPDSDRKDEARPCIYIAGINGNYTARIISRTIFFPAYIAGIKGAYTSCDCY